MIYDVNSPLFRSFLKNSTSGKHFGGGNAGGTKDLKAKGSDGKYQGE